MFIYVDGDSSLDIFTNKELTKETTAAKKLAERG